MILVMVINISSIIYMCLKLSSLINNNIIMPHYLGTSVNEVWQKQFHNMLSHWGRDIPIVEIGFRIIR